MQWKKIDEILVNAQISFHLTISVAFFLKMFNHSPNFHWISFHLLAHLYFMLFLVFLSQHLFFLDPPIFSLLQRKLSYIRFFGCISRFSSDDDVSLNIFFICCIMFPPHHLFSFHLSETTISSFLNERFYFFFHFTLKFHVFHSLHFFHLLESFISSHHLSYFQDE